MNYTFRADGGQGSTGPIRPRRACVECRTRKQKCLYRQPAPIGDAKEACIQCTRRRVPCSLQGNARPMIPKRQKRRGPDHSACPNSANTDLQSDEERPYRSPALASPVNGTGKPPQTSRFIGHLNPEAQLLSRTRPSSPSSDRERDELGVWCRHVVLDQDEDPRLSAVDSLQRYVDVIRRFQIPDESVCDPLIQIYFSTIHRFLPLVDEVAFHQDRARGKLSVSLLLAVLLAACRDDRAKPHLWFPESAGLGVPRTLPPREFAQRIYTHLTSLLKAEAETDKIILIQVHALMSLHCEGPAGNEAASLNLFTAIHYLQVLGMHLPRADETDKSGRFSTIFWSMWSLDRLNAAYNGRPTIIHERDMAHKAKFFCRDEAEAELLAPFVVWLKLTSLLDETISYYRPVADPSSTGWEHQFPSFEEVLSDKDRKIPLELMYVLELYYHAIGILTSRFRVWNPVTASNPSSVRQALSTLRVLEMAEDIPFISLPAVPVIPYTVTLCLTVSYRQCRECLSSNVVRAMRHLESSCRVLEELANQWWIAEAMGKMGQRAREKLSQNQQSSVPADNANRTRRNQSNRVKKTKDHQEKSNASITGRKEAMNAADATAGDRRAGISEIPQTDNASAGYPVVESWTPPNAALDSVSNSNSNGQEMSVYDLFLLDSIPNLVYPPSGMGDNWFDDVRLFDGFGDYGPNGQ